MNIKSHILTRRTLLWCVLMGLLALFCFGVGTSPMVHAQAGDPTGTPAPASKDSTITTATLEDGMKIEGIVINGPPKPPAGIKRPSVSLSNSVSTLGVVALPVPAYEWSFGCSATSGAMIAAYFDQEGYPNMYNGQTNGGLMPNNSSSWGYWTDGNGDTYAQNPLAASHYGLDGRTTRGSLDNYWVAYNSSIQDPYLTYGWAQHTWGDAIGDYMKTSQSTFNNYDGSTTFYNNKYYPDALTCSQMETNTYNGRYISTLDGTFGRKLFYEAKGYTVTDCYNQKTDNNFTSGGLSAACGFATFSASAPKADDAIAIATGKIARIPLISAQTSS